MEIKLIRDDLEEKKEKTVSVEEGTTVSGFLESEGIERQEVLVSRNGTIISDSHELEDDDEIEVFDVIAGG
ncbi:sulfur carrier protein ThiS [Candidatus Nanohalobium constans]|uniref:Thiamine biosynthesis protein ThiS n=1 Tax=Candidatus Nanohalobium constans TaxID=2565781 RepID=A0A5Q0UJN5_9ARCH|nr:MoaD/ThiS family protein [Candidatus Nanohalobium constans]QGA81029.1 thiamine biosynthesis protein ThiS [Candidatus Nanohalobium constans]